MCDTSRNTSVATPAPTQANRFRTNAILRAFANAFDRTRIPNGRLQCEGTAYTSAFTLAVELSLPMHATRPHTFDGSIERARVQSRDSECTLV